MPDFPSGIEAQVCADITSRQVKGRNKYGVTVAENPLELKAWLQHAYEEALDQAIYLKRAIAEMENCPLDRLFGAPKITDVKGKPISRAEVIEGLRMTYNELLRREREDDPTIKGYPDMERILDHIEAHGLYPLNDQALPQAGRKETL